MSMSCFDCHDYMDGYNCGKKEGTIEELEKIRDEIRNFDLVSTNGNSAENVFLLTRDLSVSIIDKHIAELKGE